MVAPVSTKADDPLPDLSIGIDHEEGAAAISIAANRDATASQAIHPEVDLGVVAALEATVVVVDNRWTSVRESQNFGDRHTLGEVGLETSAGVVGDQSVVGICEYDLGVLQRRPRSLEPQRPFRAPQTSGQIPPRNSLRGENCPIVERILQSIDHPWPVGNSG